MSNHPSLHHHPETGSNLTLTKSEFLSLDDARFVIFASALFLLWFLGLYVAFWPAGFGEREEQLTYILFFVSIPFCAAIGIRWKALSPQPNGKWPLGKTATNVLGIALPVLILAWGFKGIDIAIYHTEYEPLSISFARFFAGAAVTLFACVAVMTTGRRIARSNDAAITPRMSRMRAWAIGVGTLVLVTLFDINITLDTISYEPYLGPAAAMTLDRAIPLVDVFSQYGLNFVLFAIVLKILPWSMYSLTFLVALLNAAFYAVVCTIAYRIAANRLLSFLVAVFVVAFLQAASLYNPTYTPSVLGTRTGCLDTGLHDQAAC